MKLGPQRLAPLLLALAATLGGAVSCAPREGGASMAAVSPAAPSAAPSAEAPAPAGRASSRLPAARSYPLTTCAINGQEFRNSPKHRRVFQGQEVLFCCTPCVRAFDTAPEAFMPTILARIEAHHAAAAQPVAEPPLASL